MKKILRPSAAGGTGPRVWRPLAALLLAVAAGNTHAAQAPAEAFEPCVLSPEKMGNPNPWVVKDAKPPDKPYRWEGYNDKLVDTCLGPHRYRIPANHFYDQMGPDFQGSVTLLMQWPDLQAPPPGKGAEAERVYTLIASSLKYVDGVAVPQLREQFINAPSNYPYEKLDQRDRQEPAAQDVWRTLLDNSGWGSERLLKTMGNIAAYHHPADASAYMGKLGVAMGAASQSLPHDDPNRIGSKDLHAQYFPKQDAWYVFDHSASATGGPMVSRLVKDTTELRELNDARAVRLERKQKSTQFDLQDPYRTLPLKKSPFTIADNGPDLAPATHAAGLSREPRAQRGSIDDLFLRLTDAAVARDGAGMRAVGQVFIASDAGQHWLQAGRDHNQAERDAALAAQQAQAMAQQTAALPAAPQQSAPVMRM